MDKIQSIPGFTVKIQKYTPLVPFWPCQVACRKPAKSAGSRNAGVTGFACGNITLDLRTKPQLAASAVLMYALQQQLAARAPTPLVHTRCVYDS